MEEKKKEHDRKRSAPLFDIGDDWELKRVLLRDEDWIEANETFALLSSQNTDALIKAFDLGFRAGMHFAQDTYEKERQK